MTNIISIQRGDITICADYDKLVLPSSAPASDIERVTLEIMQGEYQARPTTRLLGPDGNFIEGPTLLVGKYGMTSFLNLPLRMPDTEEQSWLREYLTRDETLELARSIYDHGDTTYGDELAKFLYVALTHVGAQDPLNLGSPLGLVHHRSVSVGGKDEPLRDSYGVVLYVDGQELDRKRLSELNFPESDPFKGFLTIKLPKLVGQRPEIIALSDKIDREEYCESEKLRISLENALQSDENLFLTETSSSGLYVAKKVSTTTHPLLESLEIAMHLVQSTKQMVDTHK